MKSGGEQIENQEAEKFVDDISISSNENSQNKGETTGVRRRKKKYRDSKSRSKSKDNASANNWGNQSDDKNEEQNWGDDQNNEQKNTANNGWGDDPEENKIEGNETNWQNEQDDQSYEKRKDRRNNRDGRSARYQRSNERYNRSRERGDRYSRRNNRQQIYFPNFDKPLVTRREFEQDQDGRFDRNELNDAYKDYVNQYKKEQENSFYYDHKHEPWFIEKYDPCEIFFWRNKHDEYARFQAEKFMNEVLGQLDQEDCPYKKINMEQQANVEYTDLNGQDFDLQKAPHFAFDPDNKTLFLRYIPVQVKRADIINAFEQENIPGLVHLSMSRPIINHNFQRLAWASFNNEHECEQALQKIQNTNIEVNDFRLQAIMCRERKNRQTKSETVIICPQLPESHIKYDYVLCKKLITEVFDKEKKISSDVMKKIDAMEEDVQVKLDFALLYLRRVHAFCLYCSQDYEDERMLATPGQCGPQHLRNISKIPNEEFEELFNSVIIDSKIEEPKEVENAEQNDAEEIVDPDAKTFQEIKKLLNLDADSSSRWSGSLTFLKKYVGSAISRIEQGPRSPPEDPNQVISDFKAQDIEDFCTYKTKEIEPDKKYQCEICQKQFKGIQFVLKHIKNKHQDVIDETYERESTKSWINKKIQQKFKKTMKINYFADQNKLFQQPGYVNAKKQAYGDRGQQRGDWGRNGQNQGNQRGRGKYSSSYVDYDDPNINAKRQKEKNQERIVDYGDLFG